MEYNFFATIARMKYIERWALMRNTRPENLSEHGLEVSMISHALCVIGNVRYEKKLNPEKAALIGIYHDASEIITGDMPTPIKYYNDEIKSAYKQIESTAQKQLTEMLPDDFKEDFKDIYNPDKLTHRLVKAADKLSALIKCTEELNMGNREFEVAKESISRAISDMKCPEAEVFLCEFIPSFSLSLDEQREIH